MNAFRPNSCGLATRAERVGAPASRSGFTLVELLVATTIFGLIMGLTLVAYTGVIKRAFHSEAAIEGSSNLRFAADLLSQGVRSAAQSPHVSADGLQLTVPAEDLIVAMIAGPGTKIGPLNDADGYKANQQMIKVEDFTIAVATHSIFLSAARPAGPVNSGDVSTYFKDADDLPKIDMEDMFAEGDEVTIPDTPYGDQVKRVIKSRSNGKNDKTITFTAKLDVDVPLGTRVAATSGRRMRFAVVPETEADQTLRGELRYYHDIRKSQYRVLARGIDPSPPSSPGVPTSTATKPFVLTDRYLTVNLQHVPKGTSAGRTVQGVHTTVYARTDPSLP